MCSIEHGRFLSEEEFVDFPVHPVNKLKKLIVWFLITFPWNTSVENQRKLSWPDEYLGPSVM